MPRRIGERELLFGSITFNELLFMTFALLLGLITVVIIEYLTDQNTKIKIKKIVSISLFIAFIINIFIAFTLPLDLFAGLLSYSDMLLIHVIAASVFLYLMIVHTYYNWKPLKAYFKTL